MALCGAGTIAGVHAAAAAELGIRVAAVASRTPERAAALASRVGARAVRYDDLPGAAGLVVVATPPARHTADALRLLEAGAAVVVEKPLCRTLAEADRLVEAAARCGERLLYAENLASSPLLLELLRHARRIGSLQHIEVRALQGRPDGDAVTTDDWGGGALFDLGVHPIAVALLVAGTEPVEVTCRLRGGDGHDSDEHAELVLTFADGLRARVVASWQAGPGAVWDAQASSATGVVRAQFFPEPVLERDGDPVAWESAGDPARAALVDAGYVGQLAGFLADLEAGRTPVMDARFGRRVLDVVAGAAASAGCDGRAVSLPFTGPRDCTPLQLWRNPPP